MGDFHDDDRKIRAVVDSDQQHRRSKKGTITEEEPPLAKLSIAITKSTETKAFVNPAKSASLGGVSVAQPDSSHRLVNTNHHNSVNCSEHNGFLANLALAAEHAAEQSRAEQRKARKRHMDANYARQRGGLCCRQGQTSSM